MQLNYVTLDDVLRIHQMVVDDGRGMEGVANMGQIESVLCHIQNDDYYPFFADKLTHLFFGLCKFHCFFDGNKRTTITVCSFFLILNNYSADSFLRDMEDIVCWVSDNIIDETFLHEIMEAVVQNKFEDEALQRKIQMLQSL